MSEAGGHRQEHVSWKALDTSHGRFRDVHQPASAFYDHGRCAPSQPARGRSAPTGVCLGGDGDADTMHAAAEPMADGGRGPSQGPEQAPTAVSLGVQRPGRRGDQAGRPGSRDGPPTITVDKPAGRLLSPELVTALGAPTFDVSMTGTVKLRVSLGLLLAVLIALAALIEAAPPREDGAVRAAPRMIRLKEGRFETTSSHSFIPRGAYHENGRSRGPRSTPVNRVR